MELRSRGDAWLRINYWMLSNISLLKKWWVVVLLGLTIFMIVFALTNILLYVIASPREETLIRSFPQTMLGFTAMRNTITPAPLNVGKPILIPAAGSTSDIVAKVTNPNKQWLAERVTYSFSVDGQETKEGQALVPAGKETYLAVYAEQFPAAMGTRQITVTIKNVQWGRMSKNSVPLEEVIKVDTPRYAIVQETQPNRTVGTVTAEVTNNSFQGYWQVKFTVTLFRSGSLVGVNTLYIDKFLAHSKRVISVQWTPGPGNVDTVVVTPELDLLNANAVMP